MRRANLTPPRLAVLPGDPSLGEFLAAAGITAIIAGSFGFCVVGREPKSDHPNPLTAGQIIPRVGLRQGT